MQLLLGFLLALLIAFLAYKAHSLNQSGALAAVFTGTIIFGVGGWQWTIRFTREARRLFLSFSERPHRYPEL